MGAASSTLQAVRTAPWDTGGTVSVTGTTSSAVDLTGSAGRGVLFVCDVPFHMVWGASNVTNATTSHLLVPANTMFRVDLPDIATALGFFKVIREGSVSGTLYYATIQS